VAPPIILYANYDALLHAITTKRVSFAPLAPGGHRGSGDGGYLPKPPLHSGPDTFLIRYHKTTWDRVELDNLVQAHVVQHFLKEPGV